MNLKLNCLLPFAGPSDLEQASTTPDSFAEPGGREGDHIRRKAGDASAAARSQVPPYDQVPKLQKKSVVRHTSQAPSAVNLPRPLRDGRALREDCKPRAQMAIDRFISRGGGFCSKGMDVSLKDVGLEAMCPSHYGRTAGGLCCDATNDTFSVWS